MYQGVILTILYLVRHGITQSNIDGRHLGQRDEGLTEKGRQQARDIAELLKSERFDVIYTSPLMRARDTASEISVYHPGNGPLSDPRLIELHMGIFDGLLPDEARRQFGEEYAEREKNKFGFRIPGGESYRMALERVTPFVRDVTDEFPEGNVCIVGHQGINRAILGRLYWDHLVQPEAKIPYFEIPHDAYFKVTKNQSSVDGQLISGPMHVNLEERF